MVVWPVKLITAIGLASACLNFCASPGWQCNAPAGAHPTRTAERYPGIYLMELSSTTVGLASLIAIVVLIYSGLHIAVTLGTVSFVGVLLLKGNFDLALNLLGLAIADSVSDEAFATVPLFVMMGLVVSRCGLGRDVYEFAKVAVPEMQRYHYGKRFTVGIVAGSSVLGMIIPPSVMLIIYAVITEQSVGAMFLAGVFPGVLLAVAFCLAIVLFAVFWPSFVGGQAPTGARLPWAMLARSGAVKLGPVLLLVCVVLGGLYAGFLTPVESGAVGTLAAALIGALKGRLNAKAVWGALVDTGHITANILFLIIAASIYTRLLGMAGLPTLFGEWLAGVHMSFAGFMIRLSASPASSSRPRSTTRPFRSTTCSWARCRLPP